MHLCMYVCVCVCVCVSVCLSVCLCDIVDSDDRFSMYLQSMHLSDSMS